MNAWSYHYLKKCVLTITNPADYQFLDTLMVTDTNMGAYGNLYLQAVADDDKPVLMELEHLEQRPDHLVEPRVYWPPKDPTPKLTLDDLIGLEGEACKSVARQGDMADSFDGMRLVAMERVDLEHKQASLIISDAGLLGATPNVSTLEVRWKGSRSNILAIIVRTKSRRTWTLDDRTAHAKQRRTLQLNNSLKNSGLVR
uniref:Uncharacterized protein n=1 Tax=Haptolina brevifila TaxID=156173 RepID=A0A7S2CND6_9EUKA|mmetsp:Transcript_26753/g.53755  ORF Transcript_26753/g.53755 Transcript_26753/m.53755 type:complete len:199 (+) Transcript_26753:1064-1660(+)